MAVQKWRGCLNGRVYDARSVTVVGDVNNSALASETISLNNKRDEIKVKELQEWWDNEGKQKQSQSEELHEMEMRFCDILPSTKQFNISCTVLDQFSTETGRCKVLRVTDNTKSTIPFISFDIARGRMSYQIGRETFDIFVTDHAELLKLAKIGKHIALKGVQCVSTQIGGDPDADVTRSDAIKLTISSHTDSSCRVLTSTSAKSQSNVGGVPYLNDSEFDRMFANAMEVPN